MLSDSQILSIYGAPTKGPFATLVFPGGGKASVHASTVPVWLAVSEIMRKHGYTTRQVDTGGYNPRPKRPPAHGWSIHASGCAIDFNWQTNPMKRPLTTDMPRAMIDEIEALRTNNGKQAVLWGGHWRTPDAMHYQIVCTPSDIATGIAGSPAASHPSNALAEMLTIIADVATRTQKLNDRGHDVEVLQRCITHRTGQQLTPDGIFGRSTFEAVKNIQRISNQPETGVADRGVWAILTDGKG